MFALACAVVVAQARVGEAVPVGSEGRAEASSAESLAAEKDSEGDSGRFYAALRAGVAAFGFTQSYTPQNALKPIVRLEVGWLLVPRLELGVELVGVATANENYRLLGGLLVGRAAIHRGDWYECWFGWGVGLGASPRIGHRGLVVDQPLDLYVNATFQNRFRIVDFFALGLDVAAENMSVLQLLAAVHVRF